MVNIKLELENFTASRAQKNLKEKYQSLLTQLPLRGVYIWGTGKLGKYTEEQCMKNQIKVLGYVDNNETKRDISKKIYSCDVLETDDIVIVASFAYPQIMEQLSSLGIENYIYYEELARLMEGMETYYTAFENISSCNSPSWVSELLKSLINTTLSSMPADLMEGAPWILFMQQERMIRSIFLNLIKTS